MYSKPSQTFGLAGRQGRLNVDSVADEFELGGRSRSDKIVIIHPRTAKKQAARKKKRKFDNFNTADLPEKFFSKGFSIYDMSIKLKFPDNFVMPADVDRVIHNLTGKSINPSIVDLLYRGLNYALPPIAMASNTDLRRDLAKFHRSLRLRHNFSYSDSVSSSTSDFRVPNPSCMPPTASAPVESYIKITSQRLEEQLY
jgi:hypothetical protein